MKFLSSLTLALFAAFAAMANEPTPEEIRQQNQYVEYRLMQGENRRKKHQSGRQRHRFPDRGSAGVVLFQCVCVEAGSFHDADRHL